MKIKYISMNCCLFIQWKYIERFTQCFELLQRKGLYKYLLFLLLLLINNFLEKLNHSLQNENLFSTTYIVVHVAVFFLINIEYDYVICISMYEKKTVCSQ